MQPVLVAVRNWFGEAVAGWQRFWFTPADPATLALIRIFAGLMLLYTHAVWSLGLEDFFGPHSWVSPAAAHAFHSPPPDIGPMPNDPYDGRSFVWSWFYWIESPAALWSVHIAGLMIFASLTVGFLTRWVSILAYLVVLAYVHRTPGALFGLDQINAMLAMYLMIGPAGARYSVDAWWRARRTDFESVLQKDSVATNIAIRLIQLHMCIIYLFAGIGKLTGLSWSLGYGVWGGLANYEYQSLDATWMANWPILGAFLSHLTVYWEVYYVAAIWPRWTRPLMLLIAIPMHMGIALFMGMITFGLVMLIGNLAFVPPGIVRAVLERKPRAATAGVSRHLPQASESRGARPRSLD
jgi:hypothetical protein